MQILDSVPWYHVRLALAKIKQFLKKLGFSKMNFKAMDRCNGCNTDICKCIQIATVYATDNTDALASCVLFIDNIIHST